MTVRAARREPTDRGDGPAGAPSVCVFAPAPIVTVSVELRSDGDDEIHVHAGGQGVWVARLLAKLGISSDTEIKAAATSLARWPYRQNEANASR